MAVSGRSKVGDGVPIRGRFATVFAVCIRAVPNVDEESRLVAMRALEESMFVLMTTTDKIYHILMVQLYALFAGG